MLACRTNRKSGPITPITLYGAPFRRISEPTTERSPPKRSRQRSWLSTATAGRPGPASPGANPRPSAGLTPSTPKRLPVELITDTSWGSPSAVRDRVASSTSSPTASSMTPPAPARAATSVPPAQPRSSGTQV